MGHVLRHRPLAAIGTSAALVVLLAIPSCRQAAAPDAAPAGVVASGLTAPWDVAGTPDGAIFLSERDSGRVVTVGPGGGVTEVHRFDVDNAGEGGLLGLSASPAYAADGLLYAYFTTATDNRIVRFRPGEPATEVLTGIPSARLHNGGRIAFGPDGMLYAGTGDAQDPRAAQDTGSLAGKVLRLMPDGAVPADNPIPDSPVYAYGFRNVQGLAWDSQGRLFGTEFGPGRDDEINLVIAGGNYGWPEVTGQAGREGFVDPVVVRQPAEASWSGATFLLHEAGGAWRDSLFAAALRGQRLWRFELGPDGRETAAESLLVGEVGRIRHVAEAGDGTLWLLTSNRDGRGGTAGDDRLLRLAPPGDTR